MEKTHTLKNLIVIDITDIPATQLSLLQALLPYEACYNTDFISRFVAEILPVKGRFWVLRLEFPVLGGFKSATRCPVWPQSPPHRLSQYMNSAPVRWTKGQTWP